MSGDSCIFCGADVSDLNTHICWNCWKSFEEILDSKEDIWDLKYKIVKLTIERDQLRETLHKVDQCNFCRLRRCYFRKKGKGSR